MEGKLGGIETTPTRVVALDGLRGVAIAAVLAYHLVPSLVPGGFLGVEVFFVLSGYLLASLAFEEHRRTGRIDWRRYYQRRLRRIGPAVGALLCALVVVGPIIANADAYRLRGDVLWSAVGLTNWQMISDGSSYFSALGRPPLVRHLWSLALEIQFYVAMPVLVAWLVRRRASIAAASLGAAVLASATLMGFAYRSPDPSRAYYGTDTRVGALLTGVLLAVVLQRRPSRPRPGLSRALLHRWSPWSVGAGFVVLALLAGGVREDSRLLYPLGFLLCRAATALLVTVAVKNAQGVAVLETRALRWLGERSFGIYLWHWPLFAVLRPGLDVKWPTGVANAVALSGAIVLGHLSFAYVERPWTPRIRATTRRVVIVSLTAALLLTLSNLPVEDPIAKSLRAGERVVAAQSVTPTVSPSSAAPTTAATTTPPEATPRIRLVTRSVPVRTGPPPNSFPVTAIGDSVMLGAAGAVRARLGAESVYIDAKVSRQFSEGVRVARQLRDEGRLGEVVIIHLGTNGPPRRNDVDALMEVLHDVRSVIFVTVRMPKRWEADTNATLHDTAARYPGVGIADWFGASEGHSEWFQSDGTHLKPAGATAYADVLGSALPEPAPPSTTTTSTSTTSTTSTTTTAVPPDPVPIPVPTGPTT